MQCGLNSQEVTGCWKHVTQESARVQMHGHTELQEFGPCLLSKLQGTKNCWRDGPHRVLYMHWPGSHGLVDVEQANASLEPQIKLPPSQGTLVHFAPPWSASCLAS